MKGPDQLRTKNYDVYEVVLINKVLVALNTLTQALGIALETRRLDIFKKSILESEDQQSMLTYALKVTMTLIQNRSFRNEVLRCLVELYMR